MNNFNNSNLTKKFWSIFFTFCMLITNLAYLPSNKAFASLTHNIKVTGYDKTENNEFIYNVDDFKAGTLKLEGNNVKSPENDSFTGLENNNYKVIVNVSNGYSFNNLKINGQNHSVEEFEALNNNTYAYNLEVNSDIKDAEIEAEFSSNVSSNSQRKIYIGEELCIDETLEKPITHYSNSSFDIIPGESMGTYKIEIKSNASVGSITADENTDLIIKAQGQAHILSKDGFSIKGARSVTIFDETFSNTALNLDGGIEFSELLSINKNTSITEGIIRGKLENKSRISVDHSVLNVNSSSFAFENIKGEISINSKGRLEVVSDETGFKNSDKIILKDGGKCQIKSKSPNLTTKIYSSFNNLEEGKLINSKGISQQKEIIWTGISEDIQKENNYLCNTSEPLNESDYYVWQAKSLSPATSKFIYGKNIAGESFEALQGDIEILSATGVKQDENSNTKLGNYNIKCGSEVTLRLAPKYGYQLNKNILKNAVPQEEKCVYKFTMPDSNICLDNVFVKSEDKMFINSGSIKSVSINIPEKTILGNAYLTINPINSVSNEEKFKNKAEDFDIVEYFDVSLQEVIFKNGDESQGSWKTNITQLENPMNIKFELGENLKDKKRYCILRDHEGEVDKLQGIYTPKDSTLKFATDKYSSYALGTSDTVRTLNSTIKYENKDLNIIVEDPNNALNDQAELVVELVDEQKSADRYKILKDQLDDTHKVEKIAFFDIFIYKDSTHKEKYSKLDNPVNVFFEIPEGWDKEDLQAVLVADGEDGEFTEEVVNRDGKDYLQFSTDHFSPYAFLDSLNDEELKNLSLNDLKIPEEDDDETDLNNEENNHQDENLFNFVTGDRNRTLIIYAVVAIALSLLAILILKKKKDK